MVGSFAMTPSAEATVGINGAVYEVFVTYTNPLTFETRTAYYIVYEYNSESRHLNLPLLNDNYDNVTVIVAGLENLGNRT